MLKLLGTGTTSAALLNTGPIVAASSAEIDSEDSSVESVEMTELGEDDRHEYVGFDFDGEFVVVKSEHKKTNGQSDRGGIEVHVIDAEMRPQDISVEGLPYSHVVNRWSSFSGYGPDCDIINVRHAYAGGAVEFDSTWKQVGDVGVTAVLSYILSTVLSKGATAIGGFIAGVLLVLTGNRFTFGARDIDRCFGGCRVHDNRIARSYTPNPASYGAFVNSTTWYESMPGHVTNDVVI